MKAHALPLLPLLLLLPACGSDAGGGGGGGGGSGGVMGFVSTSSFSSEAGGSLQVFVQRSSAGGDPLTANLSLGGSATFGDYSSDAVVSVTIPAGSAIGSITITINDDLLHEDSELINFYLSGDHANPLANNHTMTIVDNDPEPLVSFTTSGGSQNETDTASILLTAQLSVVSGLPTVVPIVISGDASEGIDLDYTLAAAQITIPVGQLTASVLLQILDDLDPEVPHEKAILTITNPIGAVTGANSEATFTIADDEGLFFDSVNLTSGTSSDGDEASAFCSADLDGDTLPDLVVASTSPLEEILLLTGGVGSFTATSIASGLSGASHVATGDFDNDMDLDILWGASTTGELVWLENPSWAPHVIQASGAIGLHDLEVGDYDGDGDLDILCALDDTVSLVLQHNDGSGTFIALDVTGPGDPPYTRIISADLTEDGDTDSVAMAADLLAQFTSDANSLFWSQDISNPGGTWSGLQFADLGHLTLTKSFIGHNTTQTGIRGFLDVGGIWEESELVAGTGSLSSLAAADLDLDNNIDLITSGDGTWQGWHRNLGVFGGGFDYDTSYPMPALSADDLGIRLIDLDNDGDPDLVRMTDAGLEWHENAAQ